MALANLCTLIHGRPLSKEMWEYSTGFTGKRRLQVTMTGVVLANLTKPWMITTTIRLQTT
jgi:threonine/homoserine efflux transporter RhtA